MYHGLADPVVPPEDSIHYYQADTGNLYLQSQVLFYSGEQDLIGAIAQQPHTTASLGKMKAKVLYVLSRTDKLFPPSIAPHVMAELKAAGVSADYFEIDSDLGHSASGLDAAKWAPRLREFMASLDRHS